MNRIERLSAILIHLQTKKVVTAQEIADRFGLSIRTVYRDIRALEQAGVPVGAEAGVGYFLDDSYRLPPVMFSIEEATALLVAAKFLANLPDNHTRGHFNNALYKVKSLLRSSQKEHIQQLDERMAVYIHPGKNEPKDNEYLPLLQDALSTQNLLRLTYHAHYSNEVATRDVEPLGLCFYQDDWHLIGWCRLRNDYRDFRIDRVVRVEKLDEIVNAKQHISIDEYFARWIQQTNMIEIQLLVKNDALELLRKSKYWFGFISQDKGETQTKMTFYNHYLDGFARWLLTFGNAIHVVSPRDLHLKTLALVEDLKLHWLAEIKE